MNLYYSNALFSEMAASAFCMGTLAVNGGSALTYINNTYTNNVHPNPLRQQCRYCRNVYTDGRQHCGGCGANLPR